MANTRSLMCIIMIIQAFLSLGVLTRTSTSILVCDASNDYFLVNGACVKVSISNCIIIISDKNCGKCAKGHYFSQSLIECLPVTAISQINNCHYYNLDLSCSYCETDFYIHDSKCVKVKTKISNCRFYKTDTACDICEEGYLFDGLLCIEVTPVPFCNKYGLVRCMSCNKGYYFGYEKSISSGRNSSSFTPLEFLALIINSDVSTCKPFRDPNCIEGTSTDTCTQCASMYFLDPNGTCINYSNSPIANCLLYSSPPTCVACVQNNETKYLLLNNSCVPIPKILIACVVYSDLTTCKECDNNYYVYNGLCLPVVINGCVSYSDSTTCSSCLTGYLLSNNKCYLKVGNNLNCELPLSDISCLTCSSGYYANKEGLCLSNPTRGPNFINKCITYLFNGESLVCSICQEYHIYVNGSCNLINDPNCSVYTSPNSCKECINDTLLVNNHCQSIVNVIPNCGKYSSDGICVECLPNSKLESNKCISIYSKECLVFNSSSICKNCYPGHYPFQGVCKQVSLIENCEEYSNQSTCSKCLSGFYLFLNSCKLPTATIDNCIAYASATTCLECALGTTGTLFMSSTQYSQCALINMFIPNCVHYGLRGNCLTCASNYYVSNSKTTCVYSPIISCETLQSWGYCLKCFPGYTLNSSRTNCSLIITTIVNCLEYQLASNNTTQNCLMCLSNSYPSSDTIPFPSCLIVTTPVTNCNIYNHIGNCVSCINGLVLSNSSCVFGTITSCMVYSSNTVCSQCVVGFYLDQSGSFCTSINPTVYKNNCVEYSNDTTCAQYLPNTTSTGSPPSPLTSPLSNCIVVGYTSAYICLVCKSGYNIVYGVCNTIKNDYIEIFQSGVNVSLCINQKKYSGSSCANAGFGQCYSSKTSAPTLCFNCLYNYIGSNSATCIKGYSSPNCLFQSTQGVCLMCRPGYYLSSNLCVSLNSISILSNCKSLLGAGTCSQCLNNYFYSSSTCNKVTLYKANCTDYGTSDGQCVTCSKDYYLNSRNDCNPLNSSTLVSRCMTYNLSAQCSSCEKSYYLLANTCIPLTRSFFKLNCISYNSSQVCVSCESGTHLLSGSCIANPISNCSTYTLAGTTCNRCQKGYLLKNNTCFLWLPLAENCLNYNSMLVCTRCKEGFYLITSDLIITCRTRVNINSNCLRYNPSADSCTHCLPGYIPSNIDVCTSSSICVSNCFSCLTASTCGICDPGFIPSEDKNSCLDLELPPSCLEVSDHGVCLTCKNKMSSFGICSTTPSADSNCLKYGNVSLNNCLACDNSVSNYFVNMSGMCTSVTSAVLNCSVHDSVTTCTICNPGYYLNPSKTQCVHLLMDGCLIYLTETTCLTCTAGYHNVQGVCISQAIDPNCLTFGANSICLKCNTDYGLVSNICNPLSVYEKVDSCYFHSAPNVCSICSPGLYLSDNTCIANPSGVSAISDCLIYKDATTCQQCNNGYFVKNGKCISNPIIVPHCDQYSDSVTCTRCTNDFLSIDGKCKSVSAKIKGCMYYSSLTQCSHCYTDYLLTSSSGCEQVKTIIDHCLKYSSHSTCLQCQSEMYFDTVSSSCKSVSVEGCMLYLNSNTCYQCKERYFMNSKNECLSVKSLDVHCVAFKNASHCLTCRSGYYIDHNGTCQVSYDYNCRVPRNYSECQTCKFGYALDSSSSCVESLTITNCLLYSSREECSQCVIGYYVSLDKKSCFRFRENEFCSDGVAIGATTCNGCATGYDLINGKCIKILFPNLGEGCAHSNSDGSICVACVTGFNQEADGSCTKLDTFANQTSQGTSSSSILDSFHSILTWIILKIVLGAW